MVRLTLYDPEPSPLRRSGGSQAEQCPEGSTAESLFTFGMLSLLASLWNFALGVLTLPVMVGYLGYESFGAYSIAFALVSYGSVLELGLNWSVSKFVAEADQDTRRDEIAGIVVAGAVYQLLVGLVVFSGAIWMSNIVIAWLAGSNGRGATTVAALLPGAALCFAVGGISAFLIGVLRGLRRFPAATLLTIIGTTLSSGAPAVVAIQGGSVSSAVSAQLLAGVLACVLVAVVVYRYVLLNRHWPSIGFAVDRFLSMVSFTTWTLVSRLAQVLVLQGDKAVVAWSTGVQRFPFYSVPFGVAQKINFLGSAAAITVYPIAAASTGRRDEFLSSYFRLARAVHLGTAAIAVPLFAIGPLVLASWIGPEMASEGSFCLRIFVIGYWVSSVGSIDASCIEAWGHPRLTAWIATLSVVVATGLGGVLLALSVDPLAIVGSGVATWLVLTGLGFSVAWYCISGMSRSQAFHGIVTPVLELIVLGSVLALALSLVTPAGPFGLIVPAAVSGFLLLYGFRRMFSDSERVELMMHVKRGLR